MSHQRPDDDDIEDLLLSSRYGDLPDVRRFVDAFSPDALNPVRDDNGNTILHMAAGNGHTDVLAYLLPLVSPALLAQQNNAGSTPLHWAVLNRHLDVVRALVNFPAGQGADLIDVKNAAGRSPLGEAETAGWDEGARWLVQVMHLSEAKEQVEEEEEPTDPPRAIETKIQDADGQLAGMTQTARPAPSMSSDQEPS